MNFGYLYLAEETVNKRIEAALKALTGDWSKTIAKLANPAGSAGELAKSAQQFRLVVQDIKRKREGANITLLRSYADALEALAKLASDVPPVPTPSPAPTPEEKPAPPPNIKCPFYTKASAFPVNWNDPAAVARYTAKYPDVKKWVTAMAQRTQGGEGLTALWHYRCYGAKEGRTWAGLDGYRRPGYL